MDFSFSPLSGEGIRLTQLTQRHAVDLFDIATDDTTQRFTTISADYSLEMAEGFIEVIREKSSVLIWAIQREGSSRLDGTIELRLDDPDVPTVSVGYLVAPWARGEHVARRALRLVVAHAFAAGAHRFVLKTMRGNVASEKVARACGFQFEGVARGDSLVSGVRGDHLVFARLATDEVGVSWGSMSENKNQDKNPKDTPGGASVKDGELYEELREEGNSKEKAARIANAAAGSSRSEVGERGGEAGSYEDWTVEELHERASELEIDGRSKMNKAELIEALRNH